MNCEYFVSDNCKSECDCSDCIYKDADFCPVDKEEKFGLMTSEDWI